VLLVDLGEPVAVLGGLLKHDHKHKRLRRANRRDGWMSLQGEASGSGRRSTAAQRTQARRPGSMRKERMRAISTDQPQHDAATGKSGLGPTCFSSWATFTCAASRSFCTLASRSCAWAQAKQIAQMTAGKMFRRTRLQAQLLTETRHWRGSRQGEPKQGYTRTAFSPRTPATRRHVSLVNYTNMQLIPWRCRVPAPPAPAASTQPRLPAGVAHCRAQTQHVVRYNVRSASVGSRN
jgi:hypothetical protein